MINLVFWVSSYFSFSSKYFSSTSKWFFLFTSKYYPSLALLLPLFLNQNTHITLPLPFMPLFLSSCPIRYMSYTTHHFQHNAKKKSFILTSRDVNANVIYIWRHTWHQNKNSKAKQTIEKQSCRFQFHPFSALLQLSSSSIFYTQTTAICERSIVFGLRLFRLTTRWILCGEGIDRSQWMNW